MCIEPKGNGIKPQNKKGLRLTLCELAAPVGLGNSRQFEAKWLNDWQTFVDRYKSEPWVIGADLGNELRSGDAGRAYDQGAYFCVESAMLFDVSTVKPVGILKMVGSYL